jgi:poly(3-hydroxybutyrate) depolymerase
MRDNDAMMRQFSPLLLARPVLHRFCLLCLMCAAFAVHPAWAGKSSFTFTPEGRAPIKVWLATPAETGPRTPILFALHGMGRNAESMRNAWADYAESQGVIVVAPDFDKASFPKAVDYNLGNTHDAKGNPQPPEKWTFRYIEDLFTEVKARTGSQVRDYRLFGHSAGAQFVHRLLLTLPDSHAAQVISANAGFYVMPDASPAPYGMAASGIDERAACQAYARPLLILLGGADDDPAHPQLNNSAGARAQGPHRLARGQAFHRATQAHAQQLKCPYRWTLSIVPGVGHESEKMAHAAQERLKEAK